MESANTTLDSGLFSLVAILRVQGIPAEPEQLRHQFSQSGQSFGSTEVLRAAKKHWFESEATEYIHLNGSIIPVCLQ